MEVIAYVMGVVLEVLKGTLDAESAVMFLRDYFAKMERPL